MKRNSWCGSKGINLIAQLQGRASKREQIISKLIQMSGNPRGACLRFMRRLGLAPQRSYREWTTGEQRHLIELIEEVPIWETAKILRRSPASIRSMLIKPQLSADSHDNLWERHSKSGRLTYSWP